MKKNGKRKYIQNLEKYQLLADKHQDDCMS